MFRKIKCRCMYSGCGFWLGGLAVFALLQLTVSALTGKPLNMAGLLRIYFVISAAGTVFLGAAVMPLIRHEGALIRNYVGMGLGVLWVAGNGICLLLAEFRPAPAWIINAAELAGCYADLVLTGIFLMGFLAAKHKPAYDKDFVIIPGCSISRQGGLLPLLKGRTNRAIRFAWDQERASGKPALYIPTGGQGPDEVMSEGSAMEFYLLSHGAEAYEVYPEKLSRNTYENMLYSKKIADAVKPDAKICFVTSGFHVLRSGILARKAGLDAEGFASSTKWYFWPNAFAREVIAILAIYRLQHLAAAVLCAAGGWLLFNLR